jgi:arylsulfatase A-like enzyme
MEGTDVSAILKGRNATGPESAFIMARGAAIDIAEPAESARGRRGRKAAKKATRKQIKRAGEWRGVRTARYTYARRQAAGDVSPWVLYDNEKDPYQMRNLVEERGAASLRKDLDAMVDKWRQRLGEA